MVTLGTDGFGRSDYRAALRSFFEVDRHHVVLAALRALGEHDAAEQGDREIRHRPRTGGTVAAVMEVAVPDIGDFTDVPVIEVLVEVGQTVQEEDPLVALESDKATMEVPSPRAGVVTEVKVAVGDKVSEGTVVLLLEPAGEGADPVAAQEEPTTEAPPPPPTAGRRGEVRVRAEPSRTATPSTPRRPCAARPASRASTFRPSKAQAAAAASPTTTSAVQGARPPWQQRSRAGRSGCR